MDKATLNKKSKAQLETMAKRIGANVKTPDGKVKTKTQLVNSIIMKNRLNGGKAKPAKKGNKRTMAAKAKLKMVDLSTGLSALRGRNKVNIYKMTGVKGYVMDNASYNKLSKNQKYRSALDGQKYLTGFKEGVGTFIAPVQVLPVRELKNLLNA